MGFIEMCRDRLTDAIHKIYGLVYGVDKLDNKATIFYFAKKRKSGLFF